LILSGGFSQNTFHNDVYRSADGSTWEQVTGSAPWSAREGHEVVNALARGRRQRLLLLMGGRTVASGGAMTYLNDVWSSVDGGAQWQQVTAAAAFPARAHFGAASMGSAVLVLGGATYKPALRLNDVWRSTDGGASWTEVQAGADFSPRYGFQLLLQASLSPAVVSRREVARNELSQRLQMILTAGSTCEAGCTRYNTSNTRCATLSGSLYVEECCVSQEKCLHRPNARDVWASVDEGATWSLVASAPWHPRTFLQASPQVGGSLLLAGGYDSFDRYYGDLWQSFDGGATWQRLQGNETAYPVSTATQPAGKWAARSLGQLAMLGTCPLLLGGHTRRGAADYDHFNDVWMPSANSP
jgi:hypothetical protein